jgi:hypothetical protein
VGRGDPSGVLEVILEKVKVGLATTPEVPITISNRKHNIILLVNGFILLNLLCDFIVIALSITIKFLFTYNRRCGITFRQLFSCVPIRRAPIPFLPEASLPGRESD